MGEESTSKEEKLEITVETLKNKDMMMLGNTHLK